MSITLSDGVLRLNKEYLLQQNLELTEENIDQYGIPEEDVTLIYFDASVWIYFHRDSRVINVVYKNDDARMVSVEI